jgi:hypothetical protein
MFHILYGSILPEFDRCLRIYIFYLFNSSLNLRKYVSVAWGHSELYDAAKGEVPSKWFLAGAVFGMNKLNITTSEPWNEPGATKMGIASVNVSATTFYSSDVNTRNFSPLRTLERRDENCPCFPGNVRLTWSCGVSALSSLPATTYVTLRFVSVPLKPRDSWGSTLGTASVFRFSM